MMRQRERERKEGEEGGRWEEGRIKERTGNRMVPSGEGKTD